MKYDLICETCGEVGRIRQPKEFDPNSNNPIVFLGLVVRCDKHLDDNMQ